MDSRRSSLSVVTHSSQVAAVLSPLRQKILSLLQREDDSAVGLARKLSLSRQKVNYHVRELEKEGFVKAVREKQRRGCTERLYRATARRYVIDPHLLATGRVDASQLKDRFSSAFLVAAAAETVREVGELRARAKAADQNLATLTLQLDVRFQSAADRSAFAEALVTNLKGLVECYGSEEGRLFRFLVGGHPRMEEEER